MIILNHDYSEKVQYDDTDYPIYRKYCALSSYPNYTAHSHWHDDIELIAVLFGEMQYNINGKVVTLRQGEGIFVNSRQMHFGFSSAKKECYFLCILLHPMLLCATTAYERDYVLPILNHGNLPFVHLHKDIPWQREIWNKIQLIYDVREETAAQMKTQIAFLSIWTTLYENMPPIEKKIKHLDGDLQIIKNMIGFIQQNYKDKISLSDIAASGVVGQSKCCKLFAKYLRQTPNLYLTQYRLNKSMFLLRCTDKTVTEIAVEVGFSNGSYYAEIFKKWVGKSPTEFRKNKESSKTERE